MSSQEDNINNQDDNHSVKGDDDDDDNNNKSSVVIKRSGRVVLLHETPEQTKGKCDYVDLYLNYPDMMLFDYYDAKNIDFSKTTKLYLMAPLGRGGNGDVWFALSSSANDNDGGGDDEDHEKQQKKKPKLEEEEEEGKTSSSLSPPPPCCCAIKYFFPNKTKSQREMAQEECDHWNTIYGGILPKCHVGMTYDDGAYLCMPYLAELPKRLWRKPSEFHAIITCLN